jgi:prolipoprotein diacylglyceryltransferase
MLGTRVATYSPKDWMAFFTDLVLPVNTKKTILGGIPGLLAGLMLAKWWLRFRGPVLEPYALALPVFMAFSRFGCLKAGCCFGIPTDLPWGIQYDYHSQAFQAQLFHRQVEFQDNLSLAIHPVQVYEMIGCLLIVILVWTTRKNWKASENLFLFSLLCYSVIRFIIEFVRAPESDLILARSFLGLKSVQWILLICALILLALIIVREVRSRPQHMPLQHHDVSRFRQAALLIFISSFALLSRNFFPGRGFDLILLFLVLAWLFILGKIVHYLIKSGLFHKVRFQVQKIFT